ncbi:hypothetical protein LXL04_011719 [Taraxacum kok-saghyz]
MPPKPESSSSFFTVDNPPSLESSMAAMVDNISHLVNSSTTNQAHTQAQLNIIMKQLSTQYEQTNALLANIIKTTDKAETSKTFPKPEFQHQNTNQAIRHPKLTLATFDGSNPLDWLFQADQYFSFYDIQPPERLTMTAFHLSGDALSWYKYLFNNNLLTTWDAFTRALETRFGPSTYDNHQAALFKLRQTTTVTAYQTEFERLSNCITGLPADALLNCFLSGLRTDISQELAILRPATITQTIGLAKLIEDKHADNRSRFRYPYTPRTTTYVTPTSNTPPTITPTATIVPSTGLLPTPTKPNPTLPFTRLSPDAMQKRRAAGLCFRCPDKYHPGHKCNPPQFLIIVDNEDDLHTTDTSDPIPPEQFHSIDFIPPTDPPTNDDIPQFLSLSPAALLGAASPRALRITGYIAGQPVSVLVDCGSTHNIVQPRVAQFLQLPTNPIPTFSVTIGNGTHIHCHDYCPDVNLKLHAATFTLPFFVLPIAGADVVLGLQWLGSLGPITADFSIPQLTFTHQQQPITLTGEPLASPTTPSNLHHLLQTHSIASMHTLLFEPTLTTHDPLLSTDPHIQQLLQDFHHIFATPSQLPPNRPHDHRIPLLPNTPPVNVRPYRYPHFQKQIMTDLVTTMLKDGLIQPSHTLNALTIKDRFPIPTVDELLDELHDAMIFSKLDLRAGYHQIRVHENDIHKTAFRTVDGHYEFRGMPFGLTNAPSSFQAAMNDIFRDVLRRFVLVFFDDILVYSNSREQHHSHLRYVFETLSKHQYFPKLTKCIFGVSEIQYLGHVISQSGVATDPEKLQAIQNWPNPTTITGLRGFLGLIGYYRRFVKNYAQIATPLTDLLRRPKLEWTPAATKSLATLKQAMTTLPVLALPNFADTFDVTTDASGTGIGASASTYVRELYAITEAIKKWRQYLLGRRFHVFTDQRSLKHLLSQVIQTPEQHKWATKLLGYKFEVYYKPGKENRVADALSRKDEPQLLAISFPTSTWLQELQEYYITTEGRVWLQRVTSNTVPAGYRIQDGNFTYHPWGGHSRITATIRRLNASFHWPHIRKDVTTFIRDCLVCQQTKYSTQQPYGLLQSLPVPNQVWEDISMDFITQLPPSGGKTAIWVIVDRLSKYAHFIALPPHYTAPSLAIIFLQHIYRLHGLPKTIVSDRDPIFLSHFWKDLFAKIGTKLLHSSAYHPQTDGQTEVVNRCLESYLRCFASDEPNRWSKYLYLAEYWYNTTYHSAIEMPPFQALYGRPPPSFPHYTMGSSKVASIDSSLGDHQRLITQLKETLQRTRQRMTDQANKHRRDKAFQVGELVHLRLRIYRQSSVQKRASHKLSKRFFGPFKILARVGKVAYRLELPPESRIHPVFHVSLLRACHGNSTPSSLPLPTTFIDDLPALEPEAILDERTHNHQGHLVSQVLVKWKGQDVSEATWEDKDAVDLQEEKSDLEDKVNVNEGGVDTSTTSNPEHNRPKRVTRRPARFND